MYMYMYYLIRNWGKIYNYTLNKCTSDILIL